VDTTVNSKDRKYPVGAEPVASGAASFRVWAPGHRRVAVVVEGEAGLAAFDLAPEGDGYFSGTRADTRVGVLYRFRVDDDTTLRPDPASRFQPRGHEGPSQLVDPCAYSWKDQSWQGVPSDGQVVYEMHVGTFTREGTWSAALEHLPRLADIGITVLELMPVGEFPGQFGWGYDVVHFFAPTRLYGSPEDMRTFVDTAHRCGLGVILDVVYNHCATTGCFLSEFATSYFSRRYRNDWGHAINFDGEDASGVREFFLTNVDYWVSEFHVDGFRIDATQSIFDDSPTHIIAELTARARKAAGPRAVYVVGENEPQEVNLVKSSQESGHGLDALWNDDFHHTARVALTGRTEAYYADYRGTPQEFVSAAKHGFLYQGQYYAWQKQCRGSPTGGLEPSRFVTYLQNHDQVANSTRGLRLHELTSPGLYRAATALLLLAPQTPMLFQGQEFAASSPFLYFADNAPENAEVVKKGRGEFLSQFPSIAAAGHVLLTDPAAHDTFERCKLDHHERDQHTQAVALHRDLLKLRHNDGLFNGRDRVALDGAVLHEHAFVLRYFGRSGDDRLLLVNLGIELELTPVPEPLLAPPVRRPWKLIWSSEAIEYGGDGTHPLDCVATWHLPAQSALVFCA
jgi:maltooligosyltrehalose trehalohydrolase